MLKVINFKTQLGEMETIADENGLYLLDFIEDSKINLKRQKIFNKLNHQATHGENKILLQITDEVKHYFSKSLKIFKTPIHYLGSDFQKSVWQNIANIGLGKTASYKNLATLMHMPDAYRAIGNSVGANYHCLIIPCHRVINSNGKLGGYSSGLWRKECLLNHEQLI